MNRCNATLGAACLLSFCCSPVSAQTSGQVRDDALAQARIQLLSTWDADALGKEGPSTADGEDFVSAATAVRGWAFSFTSSSTPNNYSFPLKLKLNPTQLAGKPFGGGNIASFFRRTELEISHSPFTVKERQRAVGTLTDNYLSADPSKTAALTYKIELIAPALEQYDRELNSLIGTEIQKFNPQTRPASNLYTPEELIKLGSLVEAALSPALARVEGEMKRAFKLATTIGYTAKWDAGVQDEASIKLTGSRSALGPAAHPIGWITEGGFTHVRSEGDAAQFFISKLNGSFDIGLMESIKTGTEWSIAHYGGEGFRGIKGVLDTTKQNELNLGQSLSLRLPTGHYVSFAVRALHLGTGDVDLTLATDFGFKFLNEAAVRKAPAPK